MKDRFPKLSKKLEEMQKALKDTHEVSVQRMQQLTDELKNTIDTRLREINKRKELIREAISHKLDFKKNKISSYKSIFPPTLRHLLSVPFIYMMIVPGLVFHLFLEIYHQVCFRLYGIPLVKYTDHFAIDRHLLGYLNWFEKLNCFYCSYYNGLMSYGREITGRTERYWCPIKHAKRTKDPHSEYEKFSEYLDAEHFRKNWKQLRDFSDKEDKK